jgi:hypothetical protein
MKIECHHCKEPAIVLVRLLFQQQPYCQECLDELEAKLGEPLPWEEEEQTKEKS